MATVNQLLREAHEEIQLMKAGCGPGDGDVAREYALAMTAIEDASMRFNRGQAKRAGIFKQFSDPNVGSYNEPTQVST